VKHTHFIFSLFLIFFYGDCSYAEGFARGTLVKVPDGYAKIEDLCVGDRVISYDDQQHCIESFVAYSAQKSVDRYLRITIADEVIGVACDQQLYDEEDDVWVAAQKLYNKYTFAGHKIAVELVNSPVDVYFLAVAQHHNFLVSKAHICAHNFFPLIVLAISLAF
jgi:hypothetical protein